MFTAAGIFGTQRLIEPVPNKLIETPGRGGDLHENTSPDQSLSIVLIPVQRRG